MIVSSQLSITREGMFGFSLDFHVTFIKPVWVQSLIFYSWDMVMSLMANCAEMETISMIPKTVGPTVSSYGPGSLFRIM
jgi:hypothetical protein